MCRDSTCGMAASDALGLLVTVAEGCGGWHPGPLCVVSVSEWDLDGEEVRLLSIVLWRCLPKGKPVKLDKHMGPLGPRWRLAWKVLAGAITAVPTPGPQAGH